MENDFWLNLASKDLKKSKEFFTKIGFKINERHSAPHMISMMIGTKEVILNLFLESDMQSYSQNTISDPSESTEILFSHGAKSRLEVDQLAELQTDVMDETGVFIHAMPFPAGAWAERTPLMHEIRCEGLDL